jgi:hypothetical protein
MESYDNLTPLENFNCTLNEISILAKTSFEELYPWYYYDTSEKLKKEIIENLKALPENKFNAYLKYTKEQIQEHHVFDPEESLIQKWLKKFNLNESEFPFLFNEDIVKLVTPNYRVVKGIDNQTYFIQKDFHLHAVRLEFIKIIAFINELLPEEHDLEPPAETVENEEFYPRIFKDKNAFKLFEALMVEFGNTEQNLVNYSFVFHKMTYDGLIHPDLKQQSYYQLLNKFDIFIDKIKSLGEIGKKPLRESIYSKLKGESKTVS